MKRFFVIAVWLSLTTSVVFADCAQKQTLFSCLTKNGKRIEICNFGQTVRYSFGYPKKKPEIVVTVPIEKVAGEACYACGRYISNSVDIPNGKTIYTVFWSGDKADTDSPTAGGVEVVENGDVKASIACATEPVLKNSEGIEFKEPVIGN